MIITILKALIALPKIGAMIEKAVQQIVAWYISNQQQETYKLLIDAAALSGRAKTHEDRLKALEVWRTALSRPRYK